LLNLRQRLSKAREIAFDQGRKELHENQMGDSFDLAIGRGREFFKCLGLSLTAQSSPLGWDYQHVTPGRWDGKPRQEGRDILRVTAAAALDDEAS
jgi:hypothetical protein